MHTAQNAVHGLFAVRYQFKPSQAGKMQRKDAVCSAMHVVPLCNRTSTAWQGFAILYKVNSRLVFFHYESAMAVHCTQQSVRRANRYRLIGLCNATSIFLQLRFRSATATDWLTDTWPVGRQCSSDARCTHFKSTSIYTANLTNTAVIKYCCINQSIYLFPTDTSHIRIII